MQLEESAQYGRDKLAECYEIVKWGIDQRVNFMRLKLDLVCYMKLNTE